MSKEVANGSSLVNQSGKALGEIVSAVNSVVESIADISTVSREQSTGIFEVTEAVANIDQTTQHTAAIAEESSAAAVQLAERAAGLRELVSFFQGAEVPSRPTDQNVHRIPARKSAVPAPRPKSVPKRAAAAAGKVIAEPDAEGWSEF